jgi:hypothetical protein
MSSTMPSTKYSCSGSPLMFWNGNTAMEGLSGRANAGAGRSSFAGFTAADGFAAAPSPTCSE